MRIVLVFIAFFVLATPPVFADPARITVVDRDDTIPCGWRAVSSEDPIIGGDRFDVLTTWGGVECVIGQVVAWRGGERATVVPVPAFRGTIEAGMTLRRLGPDDGSGIASGAAFTSTDIAPPVRYRFRLVSPVGAQGLEYQDDLLRFQFEEPGSSIQFRVTGHVPGVKLSARDSRYIDWQGRSEAVTIEDPAAFGDIKKLAWRIAVSTSGPCFGVPPTEASDDSHLFKRPSVIPMGPEGVEYLDFASSYQGPISIRPTKYLLGREGLPLLPWVACDAPTVNGTQIGLDLPVTFGTVTRLYHFRFAVEVCTRRALLGVEVARRSLDDVHFEQHIFDCGVIVKRVIPGSAAARADVREGDVILRINGRDTRTPQEMVDEVNAVGPERDTVILVYRYSHGVHQTRARFTAVVPR